ncbi:thiopurine S-methyltransferase [Methylomagnum sp.]
MTDGSLEGLRLTGQGHEVVGVELSAIAVGAFFWENHLRQPARRKISDFALWEHGRLRILCGDYFALTRQDLGHIDAVYDRAALTVLPEDIRQPYVDHLRWLTPEARRVFLLTTEDAEEGETVAESQAASGEIESLHEKDFEIELAHVESVFETDPAAPNRTPQRADHKVYRLSAR